MMNLKQSIGVAIITVALAMPAGVVHADLATAVRVLDILSKLQQNEEEHFVLVAPDPVEGNGGKYLSPYKADGSLTEWGEKAMTARVAGTVGREAGKRATRGLAGRVPGVGGMLSKRVTESTAATTAATSLGGWDHIRESSDLSFDSVDDMAVYLHVHHAGTANFDKALGASMEIYPELKAGYEPAVRHAIVTQRNAAREQW